ncbi:MAG: choice-of-anchor L domain-containing protein, partial [Bacteroidota bacterium]
LGSINSLVEDVFIGGDCFEVTSTTYAGSVASRGTFAGGTSSIGIESGVVLSTGNVGQITGPNNVSNSGQGVGGGTDPDLALLSVGALDDAAVLEFDFEPTVPQISFRYVFASEEYCDFANSTFNDAFGFFLSGPGINGTFSNNAINIAQLPGGAGAVSINNVNHINNAIYYIGNIPPGDDQLATLACTGHPVNNTVSVQDIQFDGFTVILTAVANVIPCETYHIKLAVADALDDSYDSAVFLEANSFDAGGSAEIAADVPITQSTTAYEGCGVGFFNFTRTSGDINTPYVVNYTVGGTATPGVDYSPLPTSIVIPPGQTTISIPVTAFEDFIVEGTESIILVLDEPCNCDGFTAELFIEDIPEITIDMEDVEACAGLPIQIFPAVDGGVPPLFYQWSNGSGAPFYIDVASADETVSLTVNDICGQSTTETVDIDVFELEATISGSVSLCGGGIGQLQVDFNGDAPWTINYTVDGGPPIEVSDIEDNPYFLPVTEQGVYEIVSVISNGCQGTPFGTGEVTGAELNLTANLTNSSCFGGSDGIIDLVVDGGPPFTYNWSNGVTVEDPNNLPAGIYSVTVTDGTGCTGEESFVISEPVDLDITVDEVIGVDCSNPTGGSISISVGGGTPGYTYNWSNGTTLEDAVDLSAGTYTIIVTDGNGCALDSSIAVLGDTNIPIADVQVLQELTCDTTEISLNGSGSTVGDSIIYEWVVLSGGDISGPLDQASTTINGGGTYELTVTDTENGCFSTASVIVVPNDAPPLADAGPEQTLTCAIASLDLQGSGTGVNLTYDWTTLDGNIISGNAQPNPTIDASGTYTLIVVDEDNGCTDTASVLVVEDITPPTVDPGAAPTVDCAITTAILDGSGSSAGPEFMYQWTTTGGVIIGDPTTINPEVEGAGIYQLFITNTDNGCTAIDSLEVLDLG